MDNEAIKKLVSGVKKLGATHIISGVIYVNGEPNHSIDWLDANITIDFIVGCGLEKEALEMGTKHVIPASIKEIKTALMIEGKIFKARQAEDKKKRKEGMVEDNKKTIEEKYAELGVLEENSAEQMIVNDIAPFRLMKTSEVVFFNTAKRRFEKISEKVYSLVVGSDLDTVKLKLANKVFSPFVLEPVYLENETNFICLNLYNPPEWRKAERIPNPRIPNFINKLLNHLFPSQEAKEYVICWIAWAVFSRNQTILCLIGARGTGKTILSDVVTALVGREYSKIVGESILTDKFNAPMEDNRLVILEEVMANEQKDINKLKSFANNFIPLEKKGSDQDTIENYNSIMLLANEFNSVSLAPQDRRFSAPEITSIDLKKVVTEEEIDQFVVGLHDDPMFDELVEFGQYLENNYTKLTEKFSNNIPFKGKHYYDIVRSTLSEWKLFIESEIEVSKYDRIYVSDLSKAFRRKFPDSKFPTTTATLQNFLTDYLYMGEHRLGDLKKDVRSHRYIAISSEFPKEKHPNELTEEIEAEESL